MQLSTISKHHMESISNWIRTKTDITLNVDEKIIIFGFLVKRNNVINVLTTVVKFTFCQIRIYICTPGFDMMRKEIILQYRENTCYLFLYFYTKWWILVNYFIDVNVYPTRFHKMSFVTICLSVWDTAKLWIQTHGYLIVIWCLDFKPKTMNKN